MQNTLPLSNTEATLEAKSKVSNASDWLFGGAILLLLFASFSVGFESWKNLFPTSDRILFSTCLLAGIVIALARSNWLGERTWTKVRFARLACVLGAALICTSIQLSNPIWSALACGVIFGGWCIGQIRGDSVFHGMFLGLTLVVPFAIDGVENLGGFAWLDSFAVNTTSFIANVVGEPHAAEEKNILFGKGTADHYTSIGVWDSVVGLYGVIVFLILVFRRNLIPASVNLLLGFVVWAAVRSIAWVTISLLAQRFDTWYPWSLELELGIFFLSVVFVFCIDQFFAEVFEPIPFEDFNPETPMGSFVWNWLCGLPLLSLRIPKRNKISQRWRTLLHIAKKKPSWKTDFQWIRIESFDLIRHPINGIGSMIDVVRGWKSSRKWMRLIYHSPPVLVLTVIYLTIAFYSTKRIDYQTQFLLEESQKLCSNDLLEEATKQQQEEDFCHAIQAAKSEEEVSVPISYDTKRQVEIQSKRVLTAYPGNGMAKYRLALIYALNSETERASTEMTELVSGRFGDFPQGEAWLAKSLIIKNGAGVEIPVQKLLAYLDSARKWKKNDVRLLLFYARLLEERKEITKAIFIAQQAVSANPDLILELAKLYGRTGDKEKCLKTAAEAADHFFAKTNSESNNESDRLAVADAMLLSDRPDEAVKVLTEGLQNNPNAVDIRRKLCEIQLMFYSRSIKKEDDGTFDLDLVLLETAADTDPINPSISSAIAMLLRYGKRPSPKLISILKSQIDLRIVSVPSLLLFGEEFYARGNFEAAKKYWEAALEKEPENFQALNNLATCLIALSPSNADRAIEMVSKANSILPNNADIFDTWGEALLAAKRSQEAINKFEMAIRINPKRVETRKKLVLAYEASGMSEMIKYQEEAIRRIEALKAKQKSD